MTKTSSSTRDDNKSNHDFIHSCLHLLLSVYRSSRQKCSGSCYSPRGRLIYDGIFRLFSPLTQCNLGENAVEMTAFLHINIVLDRIVCVHTLVAMITYTLTTTGPLPERLSYRTNWAESGC